MEEKLLDEIKKLKANGKVKFKSMNELANELGSSTHIIKKYLNLLKNEGISLDIRTYEEKLLDSIKKLKEDGKVNFRSMKQLANELGCGNQIVKKYLNLFNNEGISIDIRTNEEKLLDSIKKLKEDGKVKFRSMKQLSKEIGVYHGTIKVHLQLFINEGIFIDIRTMEEKLLDEIKKLKKENKTDFNSIYNLSAEIKSSPQIIKKYLILFKDHGISIDTRPIEEKLLYSVKKLKKDNKTNFESMKQLAIELGVDDSTIKRHLIFFQNNGIVIDTRSKKMKLLDSIKKLKKENKTYFNNINELSLEIGCAYSTISKYLDIFKKEEIMIDFRSDEEKILDFIKKIKKEKKIKFSSINAFEVKTGLSAKVIKENLDFILKNGVYIDIKGYDEKLLDLIETLKKENKTEFSSIRSLSSETGLSLKRVKANLDIFRKNGISIDSSNNLKLNISNYIKITQEFSSIDMSLENHFALQELCEDFLEKKINVTSMCIEAVTANSDIYIRNFQKLK
jgi:biotin operon repressor